MGYPLYRKLRRRDRCVRLRSNSISLNRCNRVCLKNRPGRWVPGNLRRHNRSDFPGMGHHKRNMGKLGAFMGMVGRP